MKEIILKAWLLIGVFFVAQASATRIEIVNLDSAGEGFRSTLPVSPVPGNSGATLGAQYLNVFRAAAEVWEQRVDSSVTISIDARLDPLDCAPTSGVLGAAGPLNGFIDFPNAPRQNTIYVVAQANSLAGVDLDTQNSDIVATFNSNLGTPGCLTQLSWWLGINSPAPAGTISLFDTVLHEIGHGIGFLSLVDQNGARLANLNDAYTLNLFDVSQGLAWPSMTDARRQTSSTNNGGLVWTGQNVSAGAGVFTGGRTNGSLRLFAPSTFQQGSSVSHWDVTVSPDELMEPFATRTSNACATVLALKDMGWRTMNECLPLTSQSQTVMAPIVSFLLADDQAVVSGPVVVSEPSECSFPSIAVGGSVADQWQSSDSLSFNRAFTTFARYYSLEIETTQTVQIDLTSTVDTFLYITSGCSISLTPLASDDDGGSGFNSRLNVTLSPGLYTIEATTFSGPSTGNFEISVQ